MDKLANLFTDLQYWLIEFNDPDNWRQLIVILGSLAIAWLISRSLLLQVGRRHLEDKGGIRKFTLRSIERIIFPLSAILVILLGSSVFRTLGLPVNLFHLAMPLLLSLAGIRLLVYILRKGFAPTPMLKAWENMISTVVWRC